MNTANKITTIAQLDALPVGSQVDLTGEIYRGQFVDSEINRSITKIARQYGSPIWVCSTTKRRTHLVERPGRERAFKVVRATKDGLPPRRGNGWSTFAAATLSI